MRPIALLLAVLAVSVAAPAQAEEDAQGWLRAYIADSDGPSCHDAIAQADRLNAFDLLRGANACAVSKQWPESSFLLMAGQNRAVADAGQFEPADQRGAQRIVALYGFIYCCAGGLGKDEVLRESATRERFFALYDSWRPGSGIDYDPGWAASQRPPAQDYSLLLDALAQERRATAEEAAIKYSDDAYYALHRERQELHERNGGTFVAGSPEAEKLERLDAALRARAGQLGFHEEGPPEPRHLAAEDYEANHPTPAPAPSERVLTSYEDSVTRRCEQGARFSAVSSGGEILRVLVTTSDQWGTVWRADIDHPDSGTDRYYCAANFTGSRPLYMDEELQPLPE